MKFLLIRRPLHTRGAGAPPTSKGIRAHKQYALDALKRGTLDCLYSFAGGQGSFSIINANSAEELNEKIVETPLFLDSEFEIHLLSDYSKYMDEIAGVLEKAGR